MWEYYTYRDYQRRRMAEIERKKAREKEIKTYRLTRFDAILRNPTSSAPDRDYMAARFLNVDFKETEVKLFTEYMVPIGTVLSMTFNDRQTIYIRGRVTECKLITTHQTVVGESGFPYRITLSYEGTTQAADDSLKAYAVRFYDRFCRIGK